MKVIVSLTSTFERSTLLFYTMQSVLSQSFKPDLLLVNLSKEPYLKDSGFKSVPDWLQHKEISINFIENIGSYRKLLPALEFAGADDIIVTADDDILYHTNWLKNLVEGSIAEPESIVCCRARTIKKNIFGNFQNYSKWHLINVKSKGINILPTGGGGAVYRQNLLDLDFLIDYKFLEMAPTTDDLWFRMASLRKGTPVVVLPEIDNQSIFLKHGLGLEEENLYIKEHYWLFVRFLHRYWLKVANYLGVNQSKNDFAWDAISKYSKYREASL